MEIKRDLYLNQLINRKHNGLIKIVSGIRRCGKSYLLGTLFKKHLLQNGVDENHILQIALDTRDGEKYRNPDVCNAYVKSLITDDKMYYLLLDEIQMMDDFVSVLNGFLYIPNLDVYVTGSNSKFLSQDVVTQFRGRGDEVRVYPLSFAEFYSVHDGDWQTVWGEYALFGGMPLVLSYKDAADKAKYLNNLFKETYLKDIIERNNIKNTEEFEELTRIVASNIGGLTNPQKLENTFKSIKRIDLTAPTIKQYLDYLQDAFFIAKVLRYNIKGKKYIGTPFKCYFADTGLRNACLDFRQTELTHLMENVIYNELKIRGYSVDIGAVDLFKKTPTGSARETTEVDFVANLGNQRYYIQSAFALPTVEKQAQEEKSLLGIRDGFKKIIVTAQPLGQPYKAENGILIIDLQQFLLNPDSLEL